MDEAAEHLALIEAYEDYQHEQIQKARKELRRQREDYERIALDEPEVTVRTDEEARQLADTPHLTGDPEWDAIEMEATRPDRGL